MFQWAMSKGYITLIPPNVCNLDVDLDSLSKTLDNGD